MILLSLYFISFVAFTLCEDYVQEDYLVNREISTINPEISISPSSSIEDRDDSNNFSTDHDSRGSSNAPLQQMMPGDDDDDWKSWKLVHRTSNARNGVLVDYNDEMRHYNKFRKNRDFVNEQKKRRQQGLVDFEVSLNKFADMDDQELASYQRGLIRTPQQVLRLKSSTTTTTTTTTTTQPLRRTTTTSLKRTTTILKRTTLTTTTARIIRNPAPGGNSGSSGPRLPQSLDWRSRGAVGPVRDQGTTCGACYAFSASAVLESRLYLKNRRMVPLSPQNLIDCSNQYGNNGCDGGDLTAAFRYVQAMEGINSETGYPYVGERQPSCRFNRSATARFASLKSPSFVEVEDGDETALMNALQSGPIAVAIDGNHDSFLYYSSGVFSEPDCDQRRLTHAMLLIGYGTDSATRKPYWLVKNSFGTWWGEQGYVRIARGNNMCGIATYGIYPTLA